MHHVSLHTLYFVLYLCSLLGVKDLYHARMDTQMVYTPQWTVDWERSLISLPRWFPRALLPAWLPVSGPGACLLPEEFLTVEQQRKRVQALGGAAKLRTFCQPSLPQMRSVQATRLDALVRHMAGQQGSERGIAAYHVGVPVRLVLYEGELLLNPHIHAKEDNSTCWVREPLSDGVREMLYYRVLIVRYTTSSGGDGQLEARGGAACLLMALMFP